MTTVLLNDLPGGAELIPILVMAASDMALAFAGYPEDTIRAHLDCALVNMQCGIANELGPAAAAKIVDTLKLAVLGLKAALEAKGMGRT